MLYHSYSNPKLVREGVRASYGSVQELPESHRHRDVSPSGLPSWQQPQSGPGADAQAQGATLLKAALGAGSQQFPDLNPAQGSTLLSKWMSSTQCNPDELKPIKGRDTT